MHQAAPECNFVIRVLLWVLLSCFCGQRKNIVAAPFLYSFLIIVKSLHLHGRRQIIEPRKYCLVHIIIFFNMCFLYFFLFLIADEFGLIPYKDGPPVLPTCTIIIY